MSLGSRMCNVQCSHSDCSTCFKVLACRFVLLPSSSTHRVILILSFDAQHNSCKRRFITSCASQIIRILEAAGPQRTGVTKSFSVMPKLVSKPPKLETSSRSHTAPQRMAESLLDVTSKPSARNSRKRILRCETRLQTQTLNS